MKSFKILMSGICIPFLIWNCDHKSSQPMEPGLTQLDTLERIREVLSDPQECASCHPNHFQEWSTSMHAYAIIDPIFVALNKKGLERSQNNLDQFCVKCHSPLATILNEAEPGFDSNDLSPLSKNGIHCDVCHTMDTDHISKGTSVSRFRLDGARIGLIEDPVENSFHKSVYDPQFNNSAICSPCHDVLSPDGSFLLETTNTEWDFSPYAAMGVECQDCHMPQYSGRAAINSPVRADVHRHYFIGVDYPLTPFPGKDETIEMVKSLLENAVSLSVDAPDQVGINEDFTVTVKIKNDKTGHDVPSGNIFDRQMWIELLLIDKYTGETIFASGNLDDNGDLRDQNSEYVRQGLLEPDRMLQVFHGRAYNEQNEEIPFFWEAVHYEKNTIPAFKSHVCEYQLRAPIRITELELSVKIRFRPFPPYLFRIIGKEELLPELKIFDMNRFWKTLKVKKLRSIN